MQQEYSTVYKEFLSSKSKQLGEFFQNINKLQICCNHHIILNKIADADLENHECRSIQDNSSTITPTIVDVETCMMSSKIAHLLNSLLNNKKSKCGLYPMDPIYQFSILSAQIDGKITERAQEKALENFFNNPECEVLIASISAAATGLNITCANVEPNWNPAIEAQAFDLLHRIGQQ
ncbi:hypothetical protein O181_064545 [Austropuccinia psidii MF-1]|uniref:Helicase C-terminal domain-containing protein n=1 Tax=Austropuccinia psidii MF-1 TaxID=1389203 RepID=A0A9Q3I391_9BASI|nr:hypothetical protein [Austropuccinia psidii MF-1]